MVRRGMNLETVQMEHSRGVTYLKFPLSGVSFDVFNERLLYVVTTVRYFFNIAGVLRPQPRKM